MPNIVFKVIAETTDEFINFPPGITDRKISNDMISQYLSEVYHKENVDIPEEAVERLLLIAVSDESDCAYQEYLSVAYFWPTVVSQAHTELARQFRSDSQYKLFYKNCEV